MRQVLNSEHFNTIHVITDRSFQRPTASQCTSKPPHLLTEQGKITKKKFKSKNFGRKRNGEGGDQRMEKPFYDPLMCQSNSICRNGKSHPRASIEL